MKLGWRDERTNHSILPFLITDALILILCYIGLYLIIDKSLQSFKHSESKNILVADNPSWNNVITKGDTIISINGHKLFYIRRN